MTFTSTPISRRSVLAGGLLALAAPFALSGCSPSSTSGAGPSTIRIAWWGGEQRAAKMNEIMDLYTAETGVGFRPEFAGYDAFWERAATQAAARNLPDLLTITEQQAGSFATSLEDLGPAIEDGTIDLSSWDPRYIDAGTVDGRVTQLYLGGTVYSLVFNRPLLTAGGFSDDPNEWSWSQFHDAAVSLTKSGAARWGSTDGGGESRQFDVFLHQRGKSLIENGKVGWDPADLEEYLAAWDELRKAGGTPPMDVTTEFLAVPVEDGLIVRGDVAFQIFNHNHVPVLQSLVEDELLSAIVPVFDGGDPSAVIAGTYIALSANSQVKDASIEYINWFLNTPEVISIFEAEYGGLPSAAATEQLMPEVSEPVRRSLEFYETIQPIASNVNAFPEGGVQMIPLVRQANEAVAFGDTPEQAAVSCHEQAVAAIR